MAKVLNKNKKAHTVLKRKVIIAMSGGVDSSVAAALLVRQGYDVTGAFMKQWSEGEMQNEDFKMRNVCPWKYDRRDAMRVAAHLGIELLTLDFEKEYKEWVMSYMFREYEAGRTPNPDVLCNTYIKFGVWLDKAREMGFDYLATGHYANIKTLKHESIKTSKHKNLGPGPTGMKTYQLMTAKDDNKDQTYFLHQLNQDQLAHALFPIGDYTKSNVRAMARTFGLPTAEREESMGICFVGEMPMKDFLQQKIKSVSGNIVLSSGEVIGEHEGLAFYTIGQRHLKMQNVERRMQNGDTKPLFVVEKRFNTNELVVGFEDDPLLFKKEIVVADVHWIAGQAPGFPLRCKVRLRHRQELQSAVCPPALEENEERLTLSFETPQRAVTPGQFAVLYQDGVCLGGGVIL